MQDYREVLTRKFLLPELKFQKAEQGYEGLKLWVYKASKAEVCPRCARLCSRTYDHRTVRIKDEPFRGQAVWLRVRKRRFWCRHCQKVFSEPLAGVFPRRKTTQRYRRAVVEACENYVSIKRVRQKFRCSSSFIYGALYEQLELNRRTRMYPWPKAIGIDEHAFRRNRRFGYSEYNTMVVDLKNHRLMELVQGKRGENLWENLSWIKGRENVEWVVLDMCDAFKKFAMTFFPNARLVADKFHVLRLLNPAINRARIEITGDRRSFFIRRHLLRRRDRLEFYQKSRLDRWMDAYPALRDLYSFKESLFTFYNIKGIQRAVPALERIIARAENSQIDEIKTFARTLKKWKWPILHYFMSHKTNAMVEGFNHKAKLVKRMGYGYRSFRNFRLRLLNACAG